MVAFIVFLTALSLFNPGYADRRWRAAPLAAETPPAPISDECDLMPDGLRVCDAPPVR